jgi:hypothetical protein
MKLALVQSYQHTLRERHRRKRIVKDFGLINWFKIMRLYHTSLERELRMQLSALQVFTTLMTPEDNEKLIEALSCKLALLMLFDLLRTGQNILGMRKSSKLCHVSWLCSKLFDVI